MQAGKDTVAGVAVGQLIVQLFRNQELEKVLEVNTKLELHGHPVPLKRQETLECVTAVPNRTMKWFDWFDFVWFQTNFCIFWEENGIPDRYIWKRTAEEAANNEQVTNNQ